MPPTAFDACGSQVEVRGLKPRNYKVQGEIRLTCCEGKTQLRGVAQLPGWASLNSVPFAYLGLERFMLSVNAWKDREISW
jgi:hypothetical protein